MKVFQPHIVSAILTEPWAMSEYHAQMLSPLVNSIFNPKIEFEAGEAILPATSAVVIGASAASQSDAETVTKNISVITISGPLTKNSQFCGPAGTAQIGNWLRQAYADPLVDGILLKFDTPGGAVAGTEELGNIIKESPKPIVAFVDDLCASAGMWLAVNAREIIANNTTAQVGSIGVMTSFADMQPYYEKMGVKFHSITAPQSTQKTSMADKLRLGDYADYKANVLAPLADKFIAVVKANRSNVTDNQLTGEVFHAKDVVGSLVDSIQSFDNALIRVAELCAEQSASASETASSPNLSNTTKTMKFPKLAKAAGVEAFETADGSINLSDAQATAAEQAIADAEQAAVDLQAQQAANAEQAARITELEQQVAELGNAAGDTSATATKETDATDADSSADAGFWDRFARLKDQ